MINFIIKLILKVFVTHVIIKENAEWGTERAERV